MELYAHVDHSGVFVRAKLGQLFDMKIRQAVLQKVPDQPSKGLPEARSSDCKVD